MKRSLFAITPLVLTCALAACGGSDVSSVGTIESVATDSTVSATTEARPTTVAATVPATAAPTQPPSPTEAPVATKAPVATEAPVVTAAPVSTAAPAATAAPTSSSTSVATGGTELPTANCLALMQAGVDQFADETIEVMYPALAECTGLQDWLAAGEQVGFDPGEDPTAWAAQVCGLDGPMLSVTCQEAFAAAQNQ